MRSRSGDRATAHGDRWRIVTACLLAWTLSGCGYKVQAENMVPAIDPGTYSNSGKSIRVRFAGGGEWSDVMATIDPVSFSDALTEALRRSDLFSSVNPDTDPDYVLQPIILSQDQPVLGLNMTVWLAVRYILTEASDSSVVWQEVIQSKYTATVGDAFVGAKRLGKANEGAVRENFQNLVEQLAVVIGSRASS